jgi:hypothetical protein
MTENRNVYNILVGKPQVERLFGDRGVEDNIRMDVRETASECVGWIKLPQDKINWKVIVKMVMKFMFHENSRYF